MDAQVQFADLSLQIKDLRARADDAGVEIDDLVAEYRGSLQTASEAYDRATELERELHLPDDWPAYSKARKPAVAELFRAKVGAAARHVRGVQAAIAGSSSVTVRDADGLSTKVPLRHDPDVGYYVGPFKVPSDAD